MDADCSERWNAHRREHALEEKSLQESREAMASALQVASDNIDRRLDEMNELRAQINTERGAYLTRLEYDAKHEQLVTRVQAMETTLAGLTGRITILAALAGIMVSVIVSVVLKLVEH